VLPRDIPQTKLWEVLARDSNYASAADTLTITILDGYVAVLRKIRKDILDALELLLVSVFTF
jgi:hypothetical protein